MTVVVVTARTEYLTSLINFEKASSTLAAPEFPPAEAIVHVCNQFFRDIVLYFV